MKSAVAAFITVSMHSVVNLRYCRLCVFCYRFCIHWSTQWFTHFDHCIIAFRFRRIAHLYSQGIKPLARNSLELSNWNWLYNSTDKLTKGWLKHGAKLLQQVTASAKASCEGSSDDAMQRNPSTSSSSSWQSACGDAFGHTMMDQQLSKLMQKTSGSGEISTYCLL